MTVGEIIGKALITGHRRFLARIHPDYFMECEPSVRKANEELIGFLERPISLLGDQWKSQKQRSISLSSKPTILKFYIKTGDDIPRPISYALPFSDVAASNRQAHTFMYQATYSLFGLFQAGNVDISREVLSYVEAKIKDSLDKTDCGSGKFEEALIEHHSNQTQQPGTVNKLSRHVLAILLSKEFIQLDSTMNLEQKRAALLSLAGSLELIEEFEEKLGSKIPVIFVSPSFSNTCGSADSIILPPVFTPEDFLESMALFLERRGI